MAMEPEDEIHRMQWERKREVRDKRQRRAELEGDSGQGAGREVEHGMGVREMDGSVSVEVQAGDGGQRRAAEIDGGYEKEVREPDSGQVSGKGAP